MSRARQSATRRQLFWRLERLESRDNPSWAGVPPTVIAPPTGATAVTLSSQSAAGTAAITANEVDYYSFTATATGSYRFDAATPNSRLDTVLGVFDSAGSRLAFNDDISLTNRDSQLTVALTAGRRYYFGITNYTGTFGGSYSWLVTGSATPTPAPTPTPTPTPTSGFTITLRTTGLTATQQSIFNQAAARWSQIITGDIPNATYQGIAVDDVLIDASAAPIDGVGRVLGQAGPDALRAGSALPIHGDMEFDSADLASLEANGSLQSVVMHEMGHVLGIGTIWQQRGFLTGAGTADPRFTGPLASWAYNNLFGTTATSVPVEGNSSPVGSRDSHWRESVFGSELMTPYLSGASNPISTVTVASLADLGYIVNLAAADNLVTSFNRSPNGGGGSGSGGPSLVQGNTTSSLVGVRQQRLFDQWADQDDTTATSLVLHAQYVRSALSEF